jgi:hypothetical protein
MTSKIMEFRSKLPPQESKNVEVLGAYKESLLNNKLENSVADTTEKLEFDQEGPETPVNMETNEPISRIHT